MLNNPFAKESSKLLNDLKYNAYYFIRNSIIQHSTNRVIQQSKSMPTRQQYNKIKSFFKNGLQQTADLIYEELLDDINKLTEVAPKVEFIRVTQNLEMDSTQLDHLIRTKQEQNSELDRQITGIEQQIEEITKTNSEMEQALRNGIK